MLPEGPEGKEAAKPSRLSWSDHEGVVDLIAATLAFTPQPGTYLLMAVLRVEPSGTDTVYLRLRNTTAGVDVVPECHYVVSDLRSITLSAVITLAAQAMIEAQVKQLDDCVGPWPYESAHRGLCQFAAASVTPHISRSFSSLTMRRTISKQGEDDVQMSKISPSQQ